LGRRPEEALERACCDRGLNGPKRRQCALPGALPAGTALAFAAAGTAAVGTTAVEGAAAAAAADGSAVGSAAWMFPMNVGRSALLGALSWSQA
jgi:hypothetical protein